MRGSSYCEGRIAHPIGCNGAQLQRAGCKPQVFACFYKRNPGLSLYGAEIRERGYKAIMENEADGSAPNVSTLWLAIGLGVFSVVSSFLLAVYLSASSHKLEAHPIDAPAEAIDRQD